MKDKPVVLYVDEEKANLDSFRLSFRDDFVVLLARSGEEALRILAENPVEVLLTDRKMADMPGVNLLEKVNALFPEVLSIIIADYENLEPTSMALNQGKVYYYCFEKPWNEGMLKKALLNASEKYRLRKENDDLVRHLKETNRQLLDKIEDFDTIIYRVSHDINGSLARILGICNLAFQEALPSEYFRLISKETSVLTHTLHNIIDMHELQNYKLLLEPVHIGNLLSDFTCKTRQLFGLPESSVSVVSEGETVIVTDPALLKKAYLPVIQNAFLHSGENPRVIVEISQQGKKVNILVRDHGKGIEKDIIHKVTGKFFRGNNLSSGNGLGLYIAKKATETLNGSLSIDADRRGTKVRFQIPDLA